MDYTGLMVDGFGYIGIEEDVLVTENGAEFISTPQTELKLIKLIFFQTFNNVIKN